MFQLENAITNWRNSLLSSQNLTDSNVDELEGHLYDEIDNLVLTGLTEEEAFMVAAHRIGDHREIGQEFAKVNAKEIWRKRVFWMLSGVFVFMVIGSLSSFLSAVSGIILAWLKVNSSISGIVSSLVYVFVFIGSVFVLVGCLSNLLLKIHQRYRTLQNVLWQCLLGIFLLKVSTIFMPIVCSRIYSLEEFGKMNLFNQYVMIGWRIVWPLFIVGLLIWLKPSKRKIVQ